MFISTYRTENTAMITRISSVMRARDLNYNTELTLPQLLAKYGQCILLRAQRTHRQISETLSVPSTR